MKELRTISRIAAVLFFALAAFAFMSLGIESDLVDPAYQEAIAESDTRILFYGFVALILAVGCQLFSVALRDKPKKTGPKPVTRPDGCQDRAGRFVPYN